MCEYQPPPLTPEARAIALVHNFLESPTPEEASQFDVLTMIEPIEMQITCAVAMKEERVLKLVHQWHQAFLCHNRQGEHSALRSIARECGGEIPDFREIPAH
jgi:hypothetical protein